MALLPDDLGEEIITRLNNKTKRISATALTKLGYLIDPNGVFISLTGGKSRDLAIFRIVDEKKKPADFSYCYNSKEKSGVILTKPYDRYIKYLKG